jgi:hypothetical protein
MNNVGMNSVSMGKAPSTTFRFFRLNVQAWVGDACRVEALRPRVGSTNYPSDATHMITNTNPYPLVASASSYDTYYPGFPPWQAFATTPGSASLIRWIGDPSDLTPWLQIDLGAGNEITPTAVLICPDGDSGSLRYIQNFTFSGSNTGAFSGEQTLFYTSATLNSSFWTASLPVVFTF